MSTSNARNPHLQPHERLDTFQEGRLRVIQSRQGYRFSVDALFLSQFVTIKKGDLVLDLGTGCGIVLLMILLERPDCRAVGLEIQEELASQASRNARINGFQSRMGVVLGDLRRPPLSMGCCDVVVCNPPYRRKGSGRINPDRARAVARHEILASLDEILASARGLLRGKGRLAVVYPAVRLTDLMTRMRGRGFEPKRVQIVYPSLKDEAKLALVEATAGGKSGARVLPPILDQGDYSVS
ncbi:MAG: methyltransferase [Desulfobacteraceae bacterium]|jgi:tRNA1(Val) A37 N6-methylase TrmN6